ncbi:RagB/SusD family nutrient uptake outer membrane protein [Flavobacterium macacae]|uniref:RagB/SusD family nutrient uptake outer membrane protein n=1 Tax=Flavobacterium macacae TaxID=2488993 RepID=A0A3P3W8I7_9FLAO|nr:RagB/SusD family nutrient uptake outer membrane protein [Flavobacterium macacae]RRJ90758.1 RagB/SusD family nutrient uptake outer membrane protein [Flavobacterium macacae]
MKKTFKILSAVLIFGTANSCDNFVDVELPNSQLSSPAVFADVATANAAMTEIYSKMRDNGMLSGGPAGMSCGMGLYADELDFYGDSVNDSFFFHNNSLIASNNTVASYWNAAYSQIYGANAVMEGLAASNELPVAVKDVLLGEALFSRALVHFYLVNLYGDIPYVTTTDYQLNSTVQRISTAQAYANIRQDLEHAALLLPQDYSVGTRIRPNRSCARALLARLALYTGAWDEASNHASAVLNNTEYVLEGDLDAVFLKESRSTLWQFGTTAEGRNTDDAQNYIFTAGPPPFVGLNLGLVALFGPDDLRGSHWIGTVTDGTGTWHYANKYKQRENTGSSVEYTVVLRMEEQYLIRAEARAWQGDLIGAKEDLDAIRLRAGLPPTAADSAEEIIAAVQLQRRLEFFTEFGHRFFDLKRTGAIDTVLGLAKAGWNPTDKLFPLPLTELNANPYLQPQNPGY